MQIFIFILTSFFHWPKNFIKLNFIQRPFIKRYNQTRKNAIVECNKEERYSRVLKEERYSRVPKEERYSRGTSNEERYSRVPRQNAIVEYLTSRYPLLSEIEYAVVEYLDYQIPVNQLKGPKHSEIVMRHLPPISIYDYVGGRTI